LEKYNFCRLVAGVLQQPLHASNDESVNVESRDRTAKLVVAYTRVLPHTMHIMHEKSICVQGARNIHAYTRTRKRALMCLARKYLPRQQAIL